MKLKILPSVLGDFANGRAFYRQRQMFPGCGHGGHRVFE
jgi:hypothetical protein